MGVKTTLSLASLHKLFPSYNFTCIRPTTHGIIDTTYVVSNEEKDYILKKYERATQEQIKTTNTLLKKLSLASLNVARLLDESDTWYLYDKLTGKSPTRTNTYHIQALARFMAKMHSLTYKKNLPHEFYASYEAPKLLASLLHKHYFYYKKLSSLKAYSPTSDGIIHGDIFRDNTIFDGDKIGVFDFIDAGNGSFVFDVAVSIIGFHLKKNNTFFLNLYLNTYNQKAPKKIKRKELLAHISIASKFYALLRIQHHNSTKPAKELL